MKVIVVVASVLSSWILAGLARAAALRFGLMDIPNVRSSHATPTPRGGGIAIVAVTIAALTATWLANPNTAPFLFAWAAGGGVVAVAGFVDDVHKLSPLLRLASHLVAAAILLTATHGLPLQVAFVGSTEIAALAWVIGAAAIVWTINSYNFMDGIDGLAASQTLFVAGAGVLIISTAGRSDPIQLPMLALSAASAGFLIWNFPPAKIFMGDVGSGFVGFSVAAAAFLTAAVGSASLWTWLVLNGLFFADATTTLLTRLIRGERVYEPHRSHVYQRLARRWGSHRKVTLAYSALNVLWCLPWAEATSRWPERGPTLAVAAVLPLFVLAAIAGAGRTNH
jgi:Fuc2NAc and GlcNAc transferase